MHLQEFKAWFEGFCDALEGPPTAEQFERLKVGVQLLTKPKTVYTAEMVEAMARAASSNVSDEIIPY